MNQAFKQKFPLLTHPELISELGQISQEIQVKEGDVLMDIGTSITVIPLVVKGALKIIRIDDEGHEIFLYYIHPGQTCAITLNCCVGNMNSEVKAVAEEDSVLLVIPADAISGLLNRYEGWKKFMMTTYQNRFNEMLKTIDSIAFSQLDQRLLHYLKEKATVHNNFTLSITHQQIAHDLNSTREVISRLLKQLEKQGVITLGRNKIVLV